MRSSLLRYVSSSLGRTAVGAHGAAGVVTFQTRRANAQGAGLAVSAGVAAGPAVVAEGVQIDARAVAALGRGFLAGVVAGAAVLGIGGKVVAPAEGWAHLKTASAPAKSAPAPHEGATGGKFVADLTNPLARQRASGKGQRGGERAHEAADDLPPWPRACHTGHAPGKAVQALPVHEASSVDRSSPRGRTIRICARAAASGVDELRSPMSGLRSRFRAGAMRFLALACISVERRATP
jgi:hypothetical protein